MAQKKRPGVEKEHHGKRENNWLLWGASRKGPQKKDDRAKVSKAAGYRVPGSRMKVFKNRGPQYSGDQRRPTCRH